MDQQKKRKKNKHKHPDKTIQSTSSIESPKWTKLIRMSER